MSDAGEALGFEGIYPADGGFWVPFDQQSLYPWRYGDLVALPHGETTVQDGKGRTWFAAMVVHPTCDLGAKAAPSGSQLVRVRRLQDVSERQRTEIAAGFAVDAEGVTRVARVNCVYLAGVSGATAHSEPMYADLRETVRLPLGVVEAAGRIAAMTHEARVAIIRRDALFRYRWNLTLGDVYEQERARISVDSRFEGPKPDWASSYGRKALRRSPDSRFATLLGAKPSSSQAL